jgi:hypothetical protein
VNEAATVTVKGEDAKVDADHEFRHGAVRTWVTLVVQNMPYRSKSRSKHARTVAVWLFASTCISNSIRLKWSPERSQG